MYTACTIGFLVKEIASNISNGVQNYQKLMRLKQMKEKNLVSLIIYNDFFRISNEPKFYELQMLYENANHFCFQIPHSSSKAIIFLLQNIFGSFLFLFVAWCIFFCSDFKVAVSLTEKRLNNMQCPFSHRLMRFRLLCFYFCFRCWKVTYKFLNFRLHFVYACWMNNNF